MEILPNAGRLLQFLKQKIDASLAQDKILQKFLSWTQKKGDAVNVSYKSAAVRAFYVHCYSVSSSNISPLHDLSQDLSFALDFTLNISQNFPRSVALNLALDLDLSRSLGIALYHVCYPSDDLNSEWDLNRALNLFLDPELCKKLEELKAQLPNSDRDFPAYRQWWTNQGESWTEKLRATMIEYRDIGHKWVFTPAQIELFRQYIAANILLVNCLNSNCYVSRSVREEIEDTLLLPIAEIEHRKLAKMSETPSLS
jgi:predicted NACHT family NTPase